jgi:pimeloyl-ACP methyl ester carboxylesterase
MELLLVVGSLDSKYASMLSSLKDSCENDKVCFIEIQDAGHAIHLEKPQALIDTLTKLDIIN